MLGTSNAEAQGHNDANRLKADLRNEARWAFHRSGNFREGCLAAANLGDDADTTAAVYGQLAGAFYGESGMPAEWREKLALQDTTVSLADRLGVRTVDK